MVLPAELVLPPRLFWKSEYGAVAGRDGRESIGGIRVERRADHDPRLGPTGGVGLGGDLGDDRAVAYQRQIGEAELVGLFQTSLPLLTTVYVSAAAFKFARSHIAESVLRLPQIRQRCGADAREYYARHAPRGGDVDGSDAVVIRIQGSYAAVGVARRGGGQGRDRRVRRAVGGTLHQILVGAVTAV